MVTIGTKPNAIPRNTDYRIGSVGRLNIGAYTLEYQLPGWNEEVKSENAGNYVLMQEKKMKIVYANGKVNEEQYFACNRSFSFLRYQNQLERITSRKRNR